MKLLTLLEASKRRFGRHEHYRLYMPNGGEDGVLIGWRMDWPENHYIEFRGKPYSQWDSSGDDFQRIHDRLEGMRATVLHTDEVLDVLPWMPEWEDISKAIDEKGMPYWNPDRAFTESVDDKTVSFWVKYAGLRDFDSEEDARRFIARKAQLGSAWTMGVDNPEEHYAELAREMPVYQTDTGWRIGDPRALKRIEAEREMKNRFSWDKVDLLDVDWTSLFSVGLVNQFDVDHIDGPDLIPLDEIHGTESTGAAHVENLARMIQENLEFRPIILDSNKTIVDGHHRYEAAKLMGMRTIPAYVFYTHDDLMESIQPGVTIRYNGKPKLAVKPKRAGRDVLMMIPTAALEDGFKRGGGGFYVGPGGTGAAIGNRYENFAQWLDQNDSYEVPEIGVRDNGLVGFTNGRHRYSVLRDYGIDPMPVAMDPEDVENAQKLLGGVVRESRLDEMADPQIIRAAAPQALAMLKKELSRGISFAYDDFEDETETMQGDPQYDEKFAIWKEGYAQRRVNAAIAELRKNMQFRDGNLLVWRMLEVDAEDFLTALRPGMSLGEYWTWQRDHAEAYSGQGADELLLVGMVDPSQINWAQTILMNAHPHADDEKEINISSGTPIKLMGIEDGLAGGPIDDSLYPRGEMMTA